MKKIVKPLTFTLTAIALNLASYSQLRLPVASPFGTDIKTVIRDYPHQFSSLLGNELEQNPQTTEYDCTFKLSGAESTTITSYSAKNKTVWSWQALMLTTDDFETAKKKFKSLFSTLNHLAVKMDYGETFYLAGTYETPVEEMNFTSVILTFDQPDRITQKMKLEVSMQYELLEWKIRVIIYERDREDEERGEMIDQ